MIRLFIKLNIIFCLLICLMGGISIIINNAYINEEIKNLTIVISDDLTENSRKNKNTILFNINRNLYIKNIIIIIIATTGIVLSVITIIFIEIRGLKIYNRILKKINFAITSMNNLSNVSFPIKDEFGNLGSKINSLINIMTKIDEKKSIIINKSNLEINFLINQYKSKNVVMLDHMYKIKRINDNFIKNFTPNRKNLIDVNIFDVIEFVNYSLKANSVSNDKHIEDICNIKIKNSEEQYKVILNYAAFINENNLNEHIVVLEILSKEKLSDDANSDNLINDKISIDDANSNTDGDSMEQN